MPGMKISLDAAMRARDVSQPTVEDEMAAAELGSDTPGEVASPPGPGGRPRPRGRPRPGHGSAGSSPDSS